MRTVLILAFASALAAQEDLRNPATSPADIDAGTKTFRSHCAECHGFKGDGGRGPNLALPVKSASALDPRQRLGGLPRDKQ